MSNPWLDHLTEFKQAHPNMKLFKLLKNAKLTYVKVNAKKVKKNIKNP
jgi:hypothetical protein